MSTVFASSDEEFEGLIQDLYGIREGFLAQARLIESDRTLLPLTPSQYDQIREIVDILDRHKTELEELLSSVLPEVASLDYPNYLDQRVSNLTSHYSRIAPILGYVKKTLRHLTPAGVEECQEYLHKAKEVDERIQLLRKDRSEKKKYDRVLSAVKQAKQLLSPGSKKDFLLNLVKGLKIQ